MAGSLPYRRPARYQPRNRTPVTGRLGRNAIAVWSRRDNEWLDHVTGIRCTNQSAVSPTVKRGVRGTTCPAGANSFIETNRDLNFSNGDDITIIAWIRLDALHDSWNEIVEQEDAGDNTNFVLRLNASNGRIRFTYRNAADNAWHSWETDSLAMAAGDYGKIVFCYTFGTPSTARLWLNGVEDTGSWVFGDGTDAPIDASADTTVIASNRRRTANQGLDADVFLIGLFSRLWDGSDAKAYNQNPWQIFPPRTLWLPLGVEPIVLTMQEASHDQLADNVALIQANVLAVNEAFHENLADNLDLVQANVLALDDSDHLHFADNLDLVQANVLALDDSDHLHFGDNLDLVQANVLALDDSDHLHTGDNLDLIQASILAIADAFHAQTADNLVLDVSVVLALADSDHLHTGDNLNLVQANVLIVQDADHVHSGDNLDLIQASILAIDEAFHDHTAEAIVLSQGFVLSVAEAAHDHTADNIDLVQAAVLALDNAFHDHFGDNLDLSQGFSLIVSDAVHQVVSDNLNLDVFGATLPEGLVFTIDGKDRDFVINAKDRVFLIGTKDRVFVVLPRNRV